MRYRTLALLLSSTLIFQGYVARGQSSSQVERGNQQFQYWCAACHGSGVGMRGMPQLPGTMALQEKYKGKLPPLLEDRTDMPPVLIKAMVRNGISIMPFFRKTEINDADLDAIAVYLTRNNPK